MLGAAHVSTTLSPGISTGWGHRELQGEAQQRLQGSQHHAVERWNLVLGIENRTGNSLQVGEVCELNRQSTTC